MGKSLNGILPDAVRPESSSVGDLSGLTVAIVVNTSWNIYNFRGGLVRGIIQRGGRVVAIAPPDDYSANLQELGATYVPLRKLSRKGTNPITDLRLVFELRRIYRKFGVNIALHYTIKPVIYGSMAARLCGVSNVSTLTGLGYAFITPGLVNRVVKGLYRRALRSAHFTFFQNADDRALFVSKRLVRENKSGVIAGSGIDTDRFQPYETTEEEGKLNFLFIGRLLYDKGVVEYYEAARALRRRHPEAIFNIVGGLDDGNPSGVPATVVREWQATGDIVYHGQVADTRPYIAEATAVVLPSYREGLPRVMLEGMAMSKPLVASDVPGCRDTVDDGVNGYLVDVQSADSLAEGMQKIIDHSPAERAEMGRRGRKIATERFAEPVIVNQYLKLLTDIKDRISLE